MEVQFSCLHLHHSFINAQAFDDTSATPNSPSRSHSQCILAVVFNNESPHPFQLDSIELLAFKKKNVLLVRMTGEGKSTVILGAAALLRGATISIFPLLGLGSEQAFKAAQPHMGVELLHLDDVQGTELTSTYCYLMEVTVIRGCLIFFCSPQSLLLKSPWNQVIL